MCHKASHWKFHIFCRVWESFKTCDTCDKTYSEFRFSEHKCRPKVRPLLPQFTTEQKLRTVDEFRKRVPEEMSKSEFVDSKRHIGWTSRVCNREVHKTHARRKNWRKVLCPPQPRSCWTAGLNPTRTRATCPRSNCKPEVLTPAKGKCSL